MAAAIPLWERILTVYCLFHFSEGLWGILFSDPHNPEGSPLMRMVWYPIYLFGIFGIWRAGPQALRAITASPLTYGIAFLAFASTLWSLDPEVTSRRAFALMMTTTFGVYLAVRYPWKDFIAIVASGFALMAVVGFFGSLTNPTLFVDHEAHAGAWKGVWVEKNQMGGFMARGFVACACASTIMPERKRLWMGFAAFCLLMVLLSTSAGALLALLLGLLMVFCISMMRQSPAAALFFGYSAIVMILMAAALAIFTPDAALGALGRDSSLTGRTYIWAFVLEEIHSHLLLGQGYSVFWRPDSDAANYIRVALQWGVPNAHNGWLDLGLSLGLAGIVTSACYLGVAVWRSLSRIMDPIIGPFAITMLTLALQFSMSESVIAQQNSVVWAVIVGIAMKLAMDRPQRLARSFIPTRRLPSGLARVQPPRQPPPTNHWAA